jgi:type IX secretion system PorP/SprF family membrane protein
MRSINHKSFFPVAVALFCFQYTSAQQIFKVSQFTEHSFIYNPAAAGANGVATVGGAYRTQWAGIDGGPQTAIFFGDKYFASKNTGVGIVLYTDKTGPTSRTGGNLCLSYSVKLGSDKKRLMFGLGAQVIQFKVDKDKIAASIPNDPLLSSSGTTIKGDASAGIYYRSEGLNVGFAANQLIQSKLGFIKTSANPEGMFYRQYFINANYQFRTDESTVLVPHFEMRCQPNVPVDYEGGIILYYQDMVHVGLSAHLNQDFTLLAGIKVKHKLSIGYAYDIYKNPVSIFEYGFGAHEIMLRYFFDK